ncbi:isoaspartyl peptidase/L-asparaginase family protein [Sodalis ligni]|uniref:Isoaspartyl peptidase n=1 Tax=Sodalis ligni TaxID=2697027 RepID=A0A4R1N922_9GAMM|nr:isoaspartyl peptidase/L-asparaginase [Sodalis ligni]TCL03864.1 beta-aspartyl-peptidase (threonine type) [Sodalis ligni]
MTRPVIVIHGGAGALARQAMSGERERQYRDALGVIVRHGQEMLAQGGSAVDAVTEAVRLLEECPLFNAGKGAVYTHQGGHELDAAIMDGSNRAAGAVSGVSCIRNPILAAREVMEHSPHVMLIGAGAESFAFDRGLEQVAPDFFATPERYAQWQQAVQNESGSVLDHDSPDPIDPDRKLGTVGAVACDASGHVAAATSTGGMTNKHAGRVGDSPIIGAGCYADDATAAVSCTGTGEIFIRGVAAYDLAAQMAYGGRTLIDAAQRVIFEKIQPMGGTGGLIAVDRAGNVALPFNAEGMYRAIGYVDSDIQIGIYR